MFQAAGRVKKQVWVLGSTVLAALPLVTGYGCLELAVAG